MAYNPKKLHKQAEEVIEKHKLLFIEDIVALLPCDKTTFYKHFPVDSNELNSLKEMLELNKVQIKSSLRSKWYKSDAPALQLALYKLTASEIELQKLQMNYVDHSTKGESLNLKGLVTFED
jgi:hypothetical protein